jgi:hypothetical protein
VYDAVGSRYLAYQAAIRKHGLPSSCVKMCGYRGRGAEASSAA